MPIRLLIAAALLFAASTGFASPATATLTTLNNQPMIFELGNTSGTTTEAMRITSTGYVGIGTAAPTRQIHIVNSVSPSIVRVGIGSNNTDYAAVEVFGAGGAAGLTIKSTGSGVTGFSYGLPAGLFDTLTASNNVALGTASGSTGSVILGTGGTLRMRIVSSGLIGIGTSTPTTALEVSGTVSATRFVGDGSGITGITANVSVTDGASGSLVYRDAYGSLTANSNLSISSTTGSVGVGAGTPAWLPSNSLYAAGSVQAGKNILIGGGYNLGWGQNTAYLTGNSGSGNDSIMAFVSGTEAMRITSTGLVGIGTAAPLGALHVSNSSALQIYFGSSASYGRFGADANGTIRLYGGSIRLGPNGTDTYNFNATGASFGKSLVISGALLTTSWTGINFSSASNVTPTTPLEVSGTVSATRFVGDGSGLTGISANTTVTNGASGSLVYRDQFGSLFASSGLSISSTTGSVGIGAGAPANIGSNALYVGGQIYGAASMILADGIKYTWGGQGSWMTGNGSSATGQFIALATSGTEAMRIVSTGNVGIGTSSPGAKLEVAGSLRAANLLMIANRIEEWATNSNTELALNYNGYLGGTSQYRNVIVYNGKQYPLMSIFGSVNRVAIIGNVGGNLFTPSATLHVRGDAIFTSATSINLTRPAVTELEVGGTTSTTNITIAGTAQLGVYSSEPVACGMSYKGMLAMSNSGGLCFCNGSIWNKMEAPASACIW